MRKPFTKRDILFLKKCVSLDIPMSEIAEMMERSIGSIDNKIRRLYLVYPSKIKEKEDIMPIINKRNETKKMNKEEKKEFLQYCRENYSPMLSERWQEALVYCNAKLIDFGEGKVYSINGKPVTVFRIMEIYNASRN